MQSLSHRLWLRCLKSIIDISPLMVEPTTLLSEAISQMVKQDVDIIVVGGSQMVGWLSERDVVKLVALGVDLKKTQISAVMNPVEITLTLSDLENITKVLLLSHQYQSNCLLVVNEQGQLVGTVKHKSVCQVIEQLAQLNKQVDIDHDLPEPELAIAAVDHTLAWEERNHQEFLENSDRQRTEEALRQSEDSLLRFHKAIESTSDAIAIGDSHGFGIYVNPAFTELYGYSLEELQAVGGTWAIFHMPHERSSIFTSVFNGESWRGEVTMRSRHGSLLQVDLRVDAIKDTTGKIIGTVCIHTDVTQQRQVEEGLRLRNRAIAASSNGIIIADASIPNGPIIYVNPAFERMTGYLAEDVIGQNFRLFQSADIEQPGVQELNSAMQAGKACTVVLRNYRKDGRLLWNELNISPVYDATGQLTHYIGIQTDITERKEAETELLISQQRLQYLLTSSPAVIYTCKTLGDFGVIFVSDNITAMTGYETWEFTEDSNFWSNRIHPEDLSTVFAEFSQVLERRHYKLEYRFLHKDGTYHWLYDQGRVVEDDTGNPVEMVGYLIDMTERKQLEEELKVALEKEKELSELKSRFVSMTSHEFRTPLSTILSSAELLEHYRHKWTEEKQLTHLHRIQYAVKRMTEMLNDVLVIGKAEAGKLEFLPKSFDLVAYCRHLIEEIQANLSNQQLHFISEYEAMPCYMDDRLLGHILYNLLANAIKYSHNDSTIKFTFYCQNEYAIFEIQDQGIGIPLEDIPQLFESFHRARNVGNIVGTGLGLAIVKKCVDIYQGEISVVSQVKIGTKFTVKLPLNNQI